MQQENATILLLELLQTIVPQVWEKLGPIGCATVVTRVVQDIPTKNSGGTYVYLSQEWS